MPNSRYFLLLPRFLLYLSFLSEIFYLSTFLYSTKIYICYIFLFLRSFFVTLPRRFLSFCPLYSSFLSAPSFSLHSHPSGSLRLWFSLPRIGPAFSLPPRSSSGDFLPFRRRRPAASFSSPRLLEVNSTKEHRGPESRWRYKREGQISLPVVIAVEKRHLLPNCLLSVPLPGNLHLLQAGQHCCHEQERQNEPDC